MEKLEFLYTTGRNVNGTTTLENSWAVPQDIKHRATYKPEIPLLGLYPREMKTYGHTKTHTQMFTAAVGEGEIFFFLPF